MIHYITAKVPFYCTKCGKNNKPHAKGLCSSCYHAPYTKKRLAALRVEKSKSKKK